MHNVPKGCGYLPYGVAISPKGVAIYHWCGYLPCGVAISPKGVAISAQRLSLGSCRSQKSQLKHVCDED